MESNKQVIGETFINNVISNSPLRSEIQQDRPMNERIEYRDTNNRFANQVVTTLGSVSSSEFRHGLTDNGTSFVHENSDVIESIKISYSHI